MSPTVIALVAAAFVVLALSVIAAHSRIRELEDARVLHSNILTTLQKICEQQERALMDLGAASKDLGC